jgi:hypothetical protein
MTGAAFFLFIGVITMNAVEIASVGQLEHGVKRKSLLIGLVINSL